MIQMVHMKIGNNPGYYSPNCCHPSFKVDALSKRLPRLGSCLLLIRPKQPVRHMLSRLEPDPCIQEPFRNLNKDALTRTHGVNNTNGFYKNSVFITSKKSTIFVIFAMFISGAFGLLCCQICLHFLGRKERDFRSG